MGVGRSLRASMMSPFVTHKLRMFLAKNNKKDLGVLKNLIESEQVTTVIDKTFPMSEAAEAVLHVGEGHTQGKTVITLN